MILSYCLNPNCSEPQNHPSLKHCQNCGSGLILHSRYRSIKKIGKGGFGTTFLGIDLSLPGNPFCVIKQLRPSSNDPETFQMALELFEREAKTLGKIDHPQIPRLLDYFEDGKHFYLVQSLVKGKNLQQEVKQNGIFNESQVKAFLKEILPVLKYIHGIKMIHRDIKPANILRREQDGKLVLIDFGAVKDQVNTQLANKNYGQTAFTQFAVGTMGFAPPEQLAMRPVYSSDIYAIGATCLYLMTAKSPKDIPSDELTGELLWEKQVHLSAGFIKILRKMLEVDVRNRYKSIDEILTDLEIVPYEEQLEQNLLTHNKSIPTQGTEPDTGDNTYVSATSRLAMAIRARKSRQGRSKYVAQVTAQSILTAYAQGRIDFSQQVFNHFNFSDSNIPHINFRNSKLIQAKFEDCNLEGANFYNANLTGAIFTKANLKNVHFFKANLQGANLQGADLENTNLENANLEDANLCGANLINANITEEQLQQAQTNWATIFPDGKRHIW
ncbi:serine/threonine-protein kinase [Geminocystis sp. NIES-3709]|uniref:serine/threonine-protein kinase n=1 Tax=Geminocystis sp. NIES-3709 TaxID=1617448 RepID=UPI0005FCAFC6|nr:serine/threonine-protein kinase [Geminocystis sp. NIES-3709]BAQ64382.1 serine/threonine kinase [Geminocystis sp. NIES-3709]